MFQNEIPSIELLNVGNVVTAAVRIYRDHYKSYITVAIPATLWFLLPFLVLIPISLVLTNSQVSISSSNFLFLIPFWLLLFFYCWAKSIINTAIIGRLVFGVLVNKPETVREVRLTLAPKIWSILGAFFLLFFMVFGIFMGMILAMVILVLIITIIAMIANFQPYFMQNDVTITIVGTWMGITFMGIMCYLIIRLLTSFFILDMPLAVEENITATNTLGRSWELTKRYVWRVFTILLVATLVALPVGMILYIIFGIFWNILMLKIPFSSISPKSLLDILPTGAMLVLPFSMTIFMPIVLLGAMLENELTNLSILLWFYSIFPLSNILLLPFWQAIKAVIYYDLRTRREGMGLELRKREI